MAKQHDELIPTRRSLLSRLKDWDDQESWRDFFQTYWKLIYSAALKAGLTPAEAEEVVQETVITMTRRIKDLKYDPALGSFKGWLLHTTRWRIADQFRKRLPTGHHEQPADRTATIERIPDPGGLDMDAIWDEEWQRNLLDAALDRVRRSVSPKQYQLFDLYVIKGWAVRKITDTVGASATQVYLAKHRVGALLKKAVKELETKPI
jgi:RNA polymerase sigma-70 factor (ECF subfamily)